MSPFRFPTCSISRKVLDSSCLRSDVAQNRKTPVLRIRCTCNSQLAHFRFTFDRIAVDIELAKCQVSAKIVDVHCAIVCEISVIYVSFAFV